MQFSPLELTSKFILSTNDGIVRVISRPDPNHLESVDVSDIFKDPHGLNDEEIDDAVSPYANMTH